MNNFLDEYVLQLHTIVHIDQKKYKPPLSSHKIFDGFESMAYR